MQRDSAVIHIVESSSPFSDLVARMDCLLIGSHPSSEAKVALAIAGGGLMVSGVDPVLADIDRETLNRVFFDSARRALEPYILE